MRFIETKLSGAWIVELQAVQDDRGWFTRLFCDQTFGQKGLCSHFPQLNHSCTKHRGTIRGLHYQLPPHGEAKLVRCVRGAIQDVIVDLRRGSPTFLQWHAEVLTDENFRMVYLPEGFAHGFQTLEDDVAVIYQASSPYTPSAERGVCYGDPLVGIQWLVPDAIVSEKDAGLAWLDESFQGVNL